MAKKIAVLGTGANGAAIGADLTRAGLDVVLIDQWPENVAALRERGARIEMPGEVLTVPVRAFNLCDVCTFTDRFDIVLMLVKAYDFRWAAQLIEPYLKSDGLLVGVQNGMTTKSIADVVGRFAHARLRDRDFLLDVGPRNQQCATRTTSVHGSRSGRTSTRRRRARRRSPSFCAMRAKFRSSTMCRRPNG